MFGRVTGVCASLVRNNFEYTITVEDNCTECIEEQFIRPLSLEAVDFVSSESREVAVWVETHGEKRFAANLVRRDEDMLFEVRFVADDTVLEGVSPEHLSEPNQLTLRDVSPETLAPDPLWLLDRKIQANIDMHWPIQTRIHDALQLLRIPRPAAMPPLCGPFTGKNAVDSEGKPAHPAPLPELTVDGYFVDTWSKYAGKVKFATTYKIGPSNPRFDAWVEWIDAGDPLYFHAALPVYAGLICLGRFNGQPEWVRASDVALIGIALYVNGELHPGFVDPPLEKLGVQKYGHESCHFIPGCAATYLGDCAWMGAVFCLAPAPQDFEIRDDVYGIFAYHQILKDWYRKLRQTGGTEIIIEVNLVLSTNYLATLRQVCSGAIRVTLSDKGMMVSDLRLREIHETKLESNAALNPRRPRKVLSEQTHEQRLERQHAAEGGTPQMSRQMTPDSSKPRDSGSSPARSAFSPQKRTGAQTKVGLGSRANLSPGAPRAKDNFDS